MKNKILLIILTFFTSSISYAQSCQTLDCVANALIPQVEGVFGALMILSYIFGLVFGIKGVLKLKDWNESKGQQTKLSVPIIMLVAAACFITLPSFINLGVETLSLDKAGAKKFGNY